MTIRIVLADDHAVVRAGIRALLEAQPGLEVVGEASSGREAVEVVEQFDPDVALLDIRMPDMSGLEACREIRARFPEVEILILSMYSDETYLREALEAGARGYILKESTDDDLVRAIRAVSDGDMAMSPEMLKAMASSLISEQDQQAKPAEGQRENYDTLTPREREVFSLVVRGYSNLEVASALFISVKTVESHKANLKRKLGLRRRSELVRYAIRLELLSPTDEST